MNVAFVSDKYNLALYLNSIYNTAKIYNASRIVFLNTTNPQSSLKANMFVINILKENSEGNEEVAYTENYTIEVPDINIVYTGVQEFKTNYTTMQDNIPVKVYQDDIPIEVWEDHSSPRVYW